MNNHIEQDTLTGNLQKYVGKDGIDIYLNSCHVLLMVITNQKKCHNSLKNNLLFCSVKQHSQFSLNKHDVCRFLCKNSISRVEATVYAYPS